MQPLTGIKVLDFSTLMPGPLASLLLAEAGAEITKVERPVVGDDMRHYPPMWGEISAMFALINRGKTSLAIDLKDEAQRQALIPLIKATDVVIEQFRPGVMQRLGLDYAAMKEINPKIIYCSISGYGQTGPKADQAGHDLNYIGDTGMLSLSSGTSTNDEGAATVPPALIADIAGGTYPAVINILMAIIARDRSGDGAHLDIAMTDNVFMLMGPALAPSLAAGKWPKDSDELLTGGSPRYQLYPTKDGKLVAAAPLEEKFWRNFCGLIELPTEMIDARHPPKPVIEQIGKIILSKTAEQWQVIFTHKDCCCTIVKSLQEALDDEHFKSRGLFDQRLTNEKKQTIAALPTCLAPVFKPDTPQTKTAPLLPKSNP